MCPLAFLNFFFKKQRFLMSIWHFERKNSTFGKFVHQACPSWILRLRKVFKNFSKKNAVFLDDGWTKPFRNSASIFWRVLETEVKLSRRYLAGTKIWICKKHFDSHIPVFRDAFLMFWQKIFVRAVIFVFYKSTGKIWGELSVLNSINS